jgi:bifunctional UDP-N-acetylglucosamine pyrophosphorylase/glucosamine-1-phosphate N-acetyltransferase
MPTLAAAILAAGKSTRMKSKTIKVLHPVAGVPIIRYVLNNVATVGAGRVVLVVGHGADQVRDFLGERFIYVEQGELLGTGHALLQARPALEGQCDTVLCVYGDMPLVRPQTLQRLLAAHRSARAVMTLLTVGGDDSMGFGRIVRDSAGHVQAIVEEKVASPDVLAIKEYNAGLYCFESEWLWPRLAVLPISPAGEYYLTDMLAVAVREGAPVQSAACADVSEVLGINNRVQLAQAEGIVRAAVNRSLMLNGVTLVDPASTYVEAAVRIGRDTVIEPNTIIRGDTQIGEDCRIGPNSQIVNSTIGDGCRIWASVIEGSTVADGVSIGPFSHLRPGARVGKQTYIGNFAEVKNSTVGEHVHMGHFSYVGDATLGDDVNVGAGAITCNFNGVTKNQTIIEDGAFIGSDTLLVAPVRVGKRARTGAGSVVTHDLPDDSLAYGVPARIKEKMHPSEGSQPSEGSG